jgi:hypothetical protein
LNTFIEISKPLEQEGLEDVFIDDKSEDKLYEISEIKKSPVQSCSSSEDENNIEKLEGAQKKQSHDNLLVADKAAEVNTLLKIQELHCLLKKTVAWMKERVALVE